jgi:methionyl aminopeptidase
VSHYDDPRISTILEPGMTFTIEPMITMGDWHHRMWDDGWTAVTADGKRTAQFEHTVLVTDDGVEVLTVA